MLGTIINTGAIVAGGLIGMFGEKLIKERHQQTLTMASVNGWFGSDFLRGFEPHLGKEDQGGQSPAGSCAGCCGSFFAHPVLAIIRDAFPYQPEED